MLKGLKYAWQVLKTATLNFGGDNCFRSSAALSFYTLFSIAPIVLITISVAGIFVDSTTIRDEVTERFRTLIGEQGAQGVFVLMESIRTDESGLPSFLTGLVILVFSATTIFVQIKNGLNEIWHVRPEEGRKGWIKLIRDRLISFGIVLSLGFAMIISLVLDTLILTLVRFISNSFGELSLLLAQALQNGLILVVIYLVIFALFRWLPDAEAPRRFIWRGALVTTLLLLIGKFVIGWYISNSNFSELGGATASVVVLMLWVYYTSVILYFGVEMVKAQTLVSHRDYSAGPYARKVKIVEIEETE